MRFPHRAVLSFIFILLLICARAGHSEDIKISRCEKLQLNAGEIAFIGCNPADAFAEARRRAAHNDSNALFILGRVYELGGKIFGLQSVKENMDLAQAYYLKAAKLGNVDAQEAIGFIYRKWYPDSRELSGIYWQCRAAVMGNNEAKINIRNYLIYKQVISTVDDFCHLTIDRGEPND